MSNSYRICRYVVFMVPRGTLSIFSYRGKKLLYGTYVEHGKPHPVLGLNVLMCRPSPCIIGVETEIRFVEPVEYKVEPLKYNYLLTIRTGEGFEDRYVYPKKVWETIDNYVITPMREGGKLSQQGVILYGPPGTGKTSLAKILGEINHLHVEEIRLEATVSKWFGETEKRLYAALKRAELYEPSIALVDEAEWLLGARYRHSEYERHTAVYSNLVRLVLRIVEKWNREGRKVLFVGTTNVPPNTLDRALLRSGRLGRPVYVPLPDWEAVYEFLRMEGIDDRTADLWATKAVNLGLSMADIKLNVLPALKKGKEPDVSPQTEAGYRRYVVDIKHGREIVDRVLKSISRVFGNMGEIIRARMEKNISTIIWFVGPEPVATAFANALLMYHCKIPTVTLVDPRMIDNAIDAANSLRGVLIIPTSLGRELIELATRNCYAVALVGETHPAVESLPIYLDPDKLILPSEVTAGEFYRALAAITFSFYGIEYTEKDLETIGVVKDIKGFLRKLSLASVYGCKVKDLVSASYL